MSALDIDPRHEWALRSRVDLLRALRRWADAEAAARELIQAHEREPRSYVNLGWVFADQDRDEEALAAYMSALDIDPNDPTALEWRIAALRALRRWADAEAAARDAIERRPRVPDLHVELGRLYEERNRFEMALGQAEEALRRDPWSWSAHDQRCRSLLALLRFSDAEDDARDYVAARPSAVRPRCLLARVLDAQHRYAEAVAEYEQALSLDSTDVDAVIGMSATLRSIRCFGEAESLIIRAIDRHPNNMDLPAELAFLYRDRGDRQQADVSFELLLERATGPIESAKALYGRGWVAISDHRHADATRYFTDAVALNPHDSQTRISLAWSYLRSGESNDVIESERLCREILVEGWRNHLVHTCLGMLAYRRKEYAAAERHFRRSVELAPFDGCLTDLGALLAHLGRYDKAESFLRRALTLDAWDTQARIELGNMYLQRSEARAESDADRIDAHRALSEFRQALNSDPNSGSAALGLAVATVHSTGDLTSAEETLATALRRDVRDQPKWQLHLALARLLIQAGDADQQAEFYDRAVQQAMSAIRLASHQAEPYFVAGQAEQRLGSNANDPLLRTLHRRRAYTYFKKCRENDNDHAGATHAMRILEMEKVTSRSSSISRLALFGLSSSILVVMWTDFIWGDNVTEAMLMTLTPILIGFMVIGLLLPLLVRLKLPGGMEANLTASIDQISTGPTGHINVTAPRFPSIGGPMGQIPRLGLQHT